MLGQNSNKNKKPHCKSIVLDPNNFPSLSNSIKNNLEESKIDNSNSWVNITKSNINDKNEIIKNTPKTHIINKSEKNQKLENEVKQISEIKDPGLDITKLNSPKDQEIIDSKEIIYPIVNKKNKQKNVIDDDGFIKVGSNNNYNKLKKIHDEYIKKEKIKKKKEEALQKVINLIINQKL